MHLTVPLPRDPSAPSAARQVLDDLDPSLPENALMTARLLVSEVVTNAVKYGEGEIELLLSRDARHVRCEVVDQGTCFAAEARSAPLTDVGGWGLHLVSELSDRWGIEAGSTHVWFELTLA